MFCDVLQIEVPESFPFASWQAFYEAGKLITSKSDSSAGEFGRALQATLHRYRTCDEAVQAMIADWQKCGGSLNHEGHYRQQRDLFSFYSSGLSAIESAIYACYVIACKKYPTALDWSNQKRRSKVSAKAINEALAAVLPATHPFIRAIALLIADPTGKGWVNLRNTMVHRSLPARLFEATAGGPTPPKIMLKFVGTWSTDELRMSESDMEQQLHWLARQIDSLVKGGAAI